MRFTGSYSYDRPQRRCAPWPLGPCLWMLLPSAGRAMDQVWGLVLCRDAPAAVLPRPCRLAPCRGIKDVSVYCDRLLLRFSNDPTAPVQYGTGSTWRSTSPSRAAHNSTSRYAAARRRDDLRRRVHDGLRPSAQHLRAGAVRAGAVQGVPGQAQASGRRMRICQPYSMARVAHSSIWCGEPSTTAASNE